MFTKDKRRRGATVDLGTVIQIYEKNKLMLGNIDKQTFKSFGDEWSRFDQLGIPEDEARKRFDEYFAVFPWTTVPPNAEGFGTPLERRFSRKQITEMMEGAGLMDV